MVDPRLYVAHVTELFVLRSTWIRVGSLVLLEQIGCMYYSICCGAAFA